MKYYLIILSLTFFDLTSGHPLSNSEKFDASVSFPGLAEIAEKFRSLVTSAAPKSTFGLNLTDGHGYVWNDVSTKPINYEVGLDHEIELQKNKDQIFIDDAPNNQKVPETVQELLNNDQFWLWLSQWVGAYMEMLGELLTKIIKDEVSKQVQFYFNIFESEMSKKLTEQAKLNQESINDRLINNENKITIDDKEIPFTHNSNLDLKSEISRQIQEEIELLKRRKDKEEEKHKHDDKNKPIRVEAENVYGNSLGNGKVVNVFIFYPKNVNSVLEDIKPITDGVVNGTFTMGDNENIVINGDEVVIENNDTELNLDNNENNKEVISDFSTDERNENDDAISVL